MGIATSKPLYCRSCIQLVMLHVELPAGRRAALDTGCNECGQAWLLQFEGPPLSQDNPPPESAAGR